MLLSREKADVKGDKGFPASHHEAISAGWTDKNSGGETGLDLKNKRVLVVGLAKTGLAVARFLLDRGADVTANDALSNGELGPYADEALNLGISLEFAGHNTASFMGADLIVVSPGVPENIDPIEAARSIGVPVIGEIELASRFIEEPIVAITGTNGKTTATSLTGEMLRASGQTVFVGGNIGAPLIEYVHAGQKADVVVAEISSFQLDTTEQFRPKVATLLNVTEDHLDRYNDFDDYVRSKGQIFLNQQTSDAAVLNAADPAVAEVESSVMSQKLYFNMDPAAFESGSDLPYGVMSRGLEMTCRLPGQDPVTFNLSGLRLKGKHNLENVEASALTALVAGGDPAGIQKAIDSFQGLPHRMELIKDVDQVAYYNDSKATNVDAVKRSLESFRGPVILLMGGRDKGGSYQVLEQLVREKVKCLVVFGEASARIRSALGNMTDIKRGESLAQAVAIAHQQAVAGDVVLLSPGCSSFDMFSNYAERGDAFRAAIEALVEG